MHAVPREIVLSTDMSSTTRARDARILSALLWLAVALVVVVGVAAMLLLSPKTLYADPWRFTQKLLEMSWPANVLVSDNGHREILPNLVRYAELSWLQGGQWLQVAVGAGLAVATVWLLSRTIRADALPRPVRAAATLVGALSIFWVGNQRVLAHGNESVHAYLITLLLVAGVTALLRDARRGPALAALCGIAATFSFGSGIAVFVAFGMVHWLRGAPLKRSWPLLVALLLAVGLHLGLGETRMQSALVLAPLAQLDLVLRWLASPFIYLAWPALDPAIAAQLPFAPLRVPVQGLATHYTALAGPVMTSRWPHLLLGAAGLVGLLLMTWHSRRRGRHAMSSELMALAMAWFGLAVGGLIALGRLAYFGDYPEQLAASRYLPWSSLFWSGLLLWSVVRLGVRRPRRSALAVMLLCALAVPSTAWMGQLALRAQSVAMLAATAAAAGVIDPAQAQGENVPAEMQSALPSLRAAGVAMFAWPETRYLQGRMPARATEPVALGALSLAPVQNLLDGPAWRVQFSADSPASRLVLTCDGEPVGLATRSAGAWVGWATGAVAPHCLGAVQLR